MVIADGTISRGDGKQRVKSGSGRKNVMNKFP